MSKEKSIIKDKNRGSGRTTRLIDYYIQELFTKGEINVKDHYDNIIAHKYLVQRIKDRYKNEFNRGFQELIINNLNIKLKQLGI